MQSEKISSATVLMTVSELALFLKVSSKTVYYWVSRNEIPYVKIGRLLRFDAQAIMGHFSSSHAPSPCVPNLDALGSPARVCSLKIESGPAGLLKGASNGNY